MISVGALVVYATPEFWLGLMLIVLFSITLGILPSGGMMDDARPGTTGLAYVARRGAPRWSCRCLTLALFYVAIYARLMRASMLEVYTLDFITTARAKGLSEGAIAWSHAARNALLPVVTLAGVQFGHLLGGSILVETVFGVARPRPARLRLRCCSATSTCCSASCSSRRSSWSSPISSST